MRTLLTVSFVGVASYVLWNIKNRVMREATWQFELSGEKMQQRRVESLDKLFTVVLVTMATIFGLQSIGFDINSLLAIGGEWEKRETSIRCCAAGASLDPCPAAAPCLIEEGFRAAP